MKTRLRIFALAATAASLLPATALASPVTVTLRVETPDSTLYEGPVTTDIRQFAFASDDDASALNETTPVTCDGVGGTSTVPAPTIGAALIASGLKLDGTYFDFGTGPSPFVKQIGGFPAKFTWDTTFGAYLNSKSGNFGVCGMAVASGDDVLLAYGDGTEQLLRLNGVPATLKPGETASATVIDAATTSPVAGATIDGRTTAADGTVQIGPFTSTGPRILKATKTGAIRSNGGQVCVTDGSDGACGTVKPIAAPTVTQSTTTTNGSTGCQSFGDDGRCGTVDDYPPLVHFTNITSKTYALADAPRELKGQAGNFKNGTTWLADPSGIKDVKLRITRYVGRKCWTFDGAAEKFARLASCGSGKGAFFSVGAKAEWSYLLPAALKAGRYRVEAFAIDGKGNADKVRRWNRNHVVFRVK